MRQGHSRAWRGELVGELQPAGIVGAERVEVLDGVGPDLGDLELGLLGHDLEAAYAVVGDEGGLVCAGGRVVRGVPLGERGVGGDADNEVRGLVGALTHEERVDASGRADEGDVGGGRLGDGLEKGDVGGAREVPVFRIADHEIENGFVGG